MKTILITLLIAVGMQCFATDTLNLTISNPAPRVDDKVEISIDISFLSNTLDSQLSPEIEKHEFNQFYGNSAKFYKKTISFPKAGEYTVGPFKFDFNGKQYVTDSLIIQVDEKLPYREGVWARVVEMDGKKYLVVEQMIQNKSDVKKKKSKGSYTISYTSGGVLPDRKEFVDIEKNPGEGVIFKNLGSESTTRMAPGTELGDAGFSYIRIKYEIEFNTDFNGSFTLKKKHLINLPRGIKFEDLIISQ
jgi:hypothetical protein